MVDTWGRMVADYNESFCDRVRRLLRILPKGCRRGQVAGIAFATSRGDSPVWNIQQPLNVDRECGFWQGVVKHELERKVEQQPLSPALMTKKPIRPIPDHAGGSESIPSHVSPLVNGWGKLNTNAQLPIP